MSGRGITADGLLEVLDGADRLKRAGHDLGGTRAMDFIGQLAFEQFRVGQNDAELVVEAMKEAHHLGHTGVRRDGR